MTEKIKLTKEQSNGLEVIKKLYSIDNILKTHAKANEGAWTGNAEDVNDLSLSDLATALINGYEVEMTADEIIIKDYNNALKSRNEATSIYREMFFDGYLLGVESTLETLGIDVEGIK